jgi:beta-phosphoglucomutase-like phosphatase (HAD superfamily)
MDEARVLGLKISVCSAATKSSVVFCLTNLLGKERFEALDCFLAGDDVDKKKPDPSIYRRAAEVLGVAPGNCLVVEDSVIGLQAACGAGMSCIISYTSSTSKQDFGAAKAVYPDLGSVSIRDLVELVEGMPATF